MDRKKILYLIIFILAAGLLAFGFYYFFFKKPLAPPAPKAPALNAPAGVLPQAPLGPPPGKISPLPGAVAPLPTAALVARGGLTQAPALTQNPVLSPNLSSDGKSINFYDQNEGKFYRLGPDGKLQLLSNKIFYNVNKITWSPQGDKGILEYPDKSKVFYDFSSGRQITLPKHWEDFSFSGNGEEVAAKSIGVDPENRWIIRTKPDGTDAQPLFPMGENQDKVQIKWSPAGGVIGFSATGHPLGFDRRQIVTLGENGETFNALTVEGMGFQPLWSKKGDKLLYSAYSADTDYKPALWITNAQGEQMGAGRRKINVATWADKCAFADNDTVYCAVPDELETGAGLVPEVAKKSNDTLYKIDLKSLLKTVVAKPDSNSSMSNLVLSADGSTLYFSDANSGLLHKIKIK